jgi:Zn-dependent protease/predicted transcriptional regulator
MFIFRPWKIGRIMGIPIAVDPSWLIVFALLTFDLGMGLFPSELRLGRRFGFNPEALALGAIASLLLFAAVLAHELSHAWMAVRRGIPVIGITLFIFGGVAQIGDEPDRPATEFLIAIMGPLMSFALATVFAVIWIWSQTLLGIVPRTARLLIPVALVGNYLWQANALLVIFNLIPAFPLDGGRVLRAFVWGLLDSLRQATRIATATGRGIAALMIVLGGIFLLGIAVGFGPIAFSAGENLGGVWLIFIGIFLWQAAGEAYRSVLMRDSLKQVTVERLMHWPIERVQGGLSLASFAQQYLLRPEGHRGSVYAVEENGVPVGVIGVEQIRRIRRICLDGLLVRDAMLALTPGDTVAPQDTALRVMQQLARRDSEHAGELPVIEDGQVVGFVGHEEIFRYLQLIGK